ncbi:hypothetical protein D068_cds05960 [Bacillus atrophaeus UCMB-5137]|nr:hypothetical protein D068_cds05960 [Bacillus atrophaeus UCMB-5137]
MGGFFCGLLLYLFIDISVKNVEISKCKKCSIGNSLLDSFFYTGHFLW